MNGSSNGHTPASNKPERNGEISDLLARIQEALQIIHSPHASNGARQAASSFLETVKNYDAAPYHGFALASDSSQSTVVRHFALSLLEHALKHKWLHYTDEQAKTLRDWIVQLGQQVSVEDPLYIRNKTAQLWAETAKRCWGGAWLDMDELLLRMWQDTASLAHKEFVLFVLETLSDDVFNTEDTAAALREDILNKACVEVMTPAAVLAEKFPDRQIVKGLRCGEDGWLVRVGEFLDDCLAQDLQANEQYSHYAVRCLAVYRSLMAWIVPAAISHAACIQRCCASLAVPSVQVQIACIDALSAFYVRVHLSTGDFLSLVCPMYSAESVSLLKKIYEWSIVDPHDIDDEKYVLAKKFSELLSVLGNFVEQNTNHLPENLDIPNLLHLLLLLTKDSSFVVSIPILVTWTRLLGSPLIGTSDTVTRLVPSLLDICSSRLVRYESLPENSDNPCMVLLLEDMDTVPERHAFLGNYRRYCIQVIECIVRQKRSEAVYYILEQTAYSLRQLYEEDHKFSAENYSKNSLAILQVDAHFAVVEASLKGYLKWKSAYRTRKDIPQEVIVEISKTEADLEAWCDQLLEMTFQDPIICKRVLQLCVAFTTSVLEQRSAFMLKLLEALLTLRPTPRPECPPYMDGVKELQSECLNEMLRLAAKMPNKLLEVYELLEGRINEMINSGGLDAKTKLTYESFLFTIVLKAVGIPSDQRLPKLQKFIEPVKQLWQDPSLAQSLTTFEDFCGFMGVSTARDYMIRRQLHTVDDWSSIKLDEEGLSIQADIDVRLRSIILRPTKAYVGCSTDRVEARSQTHITACSLWQDAVPTILPNLLKLLSHAHAFYAPDNWTGLPLDMRPIVTRVLSDRFWQSGISEGSKDDFYNRVINTKTTMEGLASSIRGSIRTTRDHCYQILYGLSRLDVHFFGFEGLPQPLASALFTDTHHFSSHQIINLLTLARHLVDDCPVDLRSHFVPPILAACFAKMDEKISSEWERLGQKQVSATDDDNLTDEMKEESVLRQLTYQAVQFVVAILDPARMNPPALPVSPAPATASDQSVAAKSLDKQQAQPNMRKFCLSVPTILEPLLVFCTHALRFRDTRCCSSVIKVFRSLLPEFSGTKTNPQASAPVRDYIATSVLQACITSLHEPYFVDLQKDFAQLIASIIVQYNAHSNLPKDVLLSLPGMDDAVVTKCIKSLCKAGQQLRQQRALILDLLSDLKAVSISEMGRVTQSAGAARKERSKMQQEFMKSEVNAGNGVKVESPNYEGMAGMFDA